MAQSGGITIRADSLRADGSVSDIGVDIPVYDFLVGERAIVFIQAGAERVNGQHVYSGHEEGDEVFLDCGPWMRLVVGLVVTPDERAAYAYARTHRSEMLIEEMNHLFAAMNAP